MDLRSLINSIILRSTLWDQSDKGHHNSVVLKKLWDEVAQEVNSDRGTVKAKWKIMRDTFRKELRRALQLQSEDGGDLESYDSSWRYFKQMLFLKDQFIDKTPNRYKSEQMEVIVVAPEGEIVDESSIASSSTFCYTQTPTEKRKRKMSYAKKEPEGNIADEDETFFQLLLPHIKKLSPQKKLLLQMDMQKLVYNYTYGETEDGR